MTVVLAYIDHEHDCAWIGGDSCASDSTGYSIIKNPKVFNPIGRKDILIGFAGSFRLPNLLAHVPGLFPDEDELPTEEIDMGYLVTEFVPILEALSKDFDEEDVCDLLVTVNNHLYRVQSDFSIIEPADDVDAIGIGGSVALGAFKVLNELKPDLPIEDRIKYALNVACNTCNGCQPPFVLKQTEKIEHTEKDSDKKDKDKAKNCTFNIVRKKDKDKDNNTKDNSKSKKKKHKH